MFLIMLNFKFLLLFYNKILFFDNVKFLNLLILLDVEENWMEYFLVFFLNLYVNKVIFDFNDIIMLFILDLGNFL